MARFLSQDKLEGFEKYKVLFLDDKLKYDGLFIHYIYINMKII